MEMRVNEQGTIVVRLHADQKIIIEDPAQSAISLHNTGGSLDIKARYGSGRPIWYKLAYGKIVKATKTGEKR